MELFHHPYIKCFCFEKTIGEVEVGMAENKPFLVSVGNLDAQFYDNRYDPLRLEGNLGPKQERVTTLVVRPTTM